jgi:hypothetical protein
LSFFEGDSLSKASILSTETVYAVAFFIAKMLATTAVLGFPPLAL